MAAHDVDLFFCVGGVAVESHHHGLSIHLHVAYVLVEVLKTLGQTLVVLVLYLVHGHAAVHLQTLCRGHDDGKLGLKIGLAAFYVEEFLGTQIGAESGFCNDIIAKGHGHLCGEDRVAAVGYVGKRSAVHKGSRVFGCLHEVGVEGVAQQNGYGAGHAEVFDGKGLAIRGEAEQYVFYAAAQVGLVGGEAEDGHDLGSGCDVERRLAHHAVGLGSQACDDVTQAAVVDVEHAVPQHLFHGKTVVAVLVDIVVEQSRDHVVCRGNGVEIAREMEVYLVHGQHLCVSASCRSAFLSEAGTERRLTQGADGFLAYAVEAEGQAHRHGCLAYARLCGGDGCHKNEVALLCSLFIDEL